jgi:hypothetical protein
MRYERIPGVFEGGFLGFYRELEEGEQGIFLFKKIDFSAVISHLT